jgi:hypothetical protein
MKVLQANGLMIKCDFLFLIVCYSEKDFKRRYIDCHTNYLPEILYTYVGY